MSPSPPAGAQEEATRANICSFCSAGQKRLGFPRTGSRLFLTHPLIPPDPREHRYEYWRVIAQALNLDVEPRDKIQFSPPQTGDGFYPYRAGQPVRVWPLSATAA